MKLVIDINDKVYEDSKKLVEYGFGSLPYVEAIANGTPYEERPKGKWVFVQDDTNPNIGNWHCSNFHRGAKPHTNFCPNCGADMRGG